MKRIFHPWNKWECYKAGFYSTSIDISSDEAKIIYRDFLSDLNRFEIALKKVIREWKFSCEHFLSNPSLNKIAWLGQASACIEIGLPSKFRSGFSLMNINQQRAANNLAYRYYLIWKSEYNNISGNGKNKDIQLVFPTMCQMS